MIFWYRNSFLASIVSIVGCVIALIGIAGIRNKEIGVGIGILVIAVGAGVAFLGKLISDWKEKKRLEKELAEKRSTQEKKQSSAQASGFTGSTANTTGAKSSTSSTSYSTGFTDGASQSAGFASGTAQSSGFAKSTEKDSGPSATESTRETVRFCTKCGARLVPGAIFCSSCGARITPPPGAEASGYTQAEEKPKATVEEILKRAREYANAEDYQKELDTLMNGLSIYPENAILLNNIGRANRRLGRFDTALEYYYRSAAIDPNDPSIGINIAIAFFGKKEYDRAKPMFEAEIKRLVYWENE